MQWSLAAVLVMAIVITVVPAKAFDVPAKADGAVRFATFNTSLNDRSAGGIVRRLDGGGDSQARQIAEVIQLVRPDVLVIQELDRDADGRSLALFRADYLGVGQNGAEPIDYPHTVFPPSNTGVSSGVDLDGDGRVGLPGDARGFGFHPGQYAFAVVSRLPLGEARTFANFLWRDVPDTAIPPGHYTDAAANVLPLSSKTHVIVPVQTEDGTIHVVASHPTPPVFDDPKSDFNGRRNADEIRLLVDLLSPSTSQWVVDDAGWPGGLGAGASAVVMGDLNADPDRGDARPGAIARLLDDARITPVVPQSGRGDITASFNGGMRVDYVIPTGDLVVTGSGVFWPDEGDPLARLNDASDHHLVWVDVRRP